MTEIACAFKMNNNKCSILTKKSCMRCNFFKTIEEVEQGRKDSEERIRRLSEPKRREIFYKYKFSTSIELEEGDENNDSI